MKVIVASKNNVKIEAVRQGFNQSFIEETFDISGISVPSRVSDQPMNVNETMMGSINRAIGAFEKNKDADFWVGIEGGVELDKFGLRCFAVITILCIHKINERDTIEIEKIRDSVSQEDYNELKKYFKTGISETGAFYLPKKVQKLVIEEGLELGEADDIVFKKTDSKKKNGAVGLLTNDLITRTSYYIHAVILALIPFKNENSELY